MQDKKLTKQMEKVVKGVVRSGIRTHAHIRGPECSLDSSEEYISWVWRLRPLGHPDFTSIWKKVSSFQLFLGISNSLILQEVWRVGRKIYLLCIPRVFLGASERCWVFTRPIMNFGMLGTLFLSTRHYFAKGLKNVHHELAKIRNS